MTRPLAARPLKRVIQHRILDALATQILEGKIQDGARITADVNPKQHAELRFATDRA